MTTIFAERPAGLPLTGLAPAGFAGAPCRADPELFFPADGDTEGEDKAKSICAGCPYRAPCLAFALASGQVHGIWGGLTEDERRQAGIRCPRCGGAAEGRNTYCGAGCREAARADSRRAYAQFRAVRRRGLARPRRVRLHTARAS